MASDYTKIKLMVYDSGPFPCGASIHLRYNGTMYVAMGLGRDFSMAMATATRKLREKTGLPEWMVQEYIDGADIQEPLE